jgi:hypothetical protein
MELNNEQLKIDFDFDVSKRAYLEFLYETIKNAIQNIDEKTVDTVYSLWFWFTRPFVLIEDCQSYDDYSLRLVYNTTTNYEKHVSENADENISKWDFDYWLWDKHVFFPTKDCELFMQWQQDTPHVENLFKEIFVEAIVTLTRRLFEEKIIEQKFGKNIPIIIDEYVGDYEAAIDWTTRSNPQGVADEFIEWASTVNLLFILS